MHKVNYVALLKKKIKKEIEITGNGLSAFKSCSFSMVQLEIGSFPPPGLTASYSFPPAPTKSACPE